MGCAAINRNTRSQAEQTAKTAYFTDISSPKKNSSKNTYTDIKFWQFNAVAMVFSRFPDKQFA
jgi:hypothetical protein